MCRVISLENKGICLFSSFVSFNFFPLDSAVIAFKDELVCERERERERERINPWVFMLSLPPEMSQEHKE